VFELMIDGPDPQFAWARQVICVNGLVFSLRRRLSGRWKSAKSWVWISTFPPPINRFLVLVFGFQV
jgi:hypothetical protein